MRGGVRNKGQRAGARGKGQKRGQGHNRSRDKAKKKGKYKSQKLRQGTRSRDTQQQRQGPELTTSTRARDKCKMRYWGCRWGVLGLGVFKLGNNIIGIQHKTVGVEMGGRWGEGGGGGFQGQGTSNRGKELGT